MNPSALPSLSRFFDPQGIAIVGASATPGKIGAMPVSLLLQYGYDCRIVPVNPRADTIAGLPAVPGLAALDADVDLATLAVPAAHAAQALERALRARWARPWCLPPAFAKRANKAPPSRTGCAPSRASAASGCWDLTAWAS